MRSLLVRLDDNTKEHLKELAILDKRSMSKEIEAIIEEKYSELSIGGKENEK